MRLEQITESNKQAYQSFVQANGYFLQTWQWGEFQKSLGREVLHYLLFNTQSQPILSAQLVVNQIGKKRYLYCPYGPVIAREYLAESAKILQTFFTQLQKQLQGNNFVFIRIEPYVTDNFSSEFNSFLSKSTDLNPHQTLILNLKQDLAQIQANMHPKTRYNIKVAQKHGVGVQTFRADQQTAASQQVIEQATELFRQTSKRAQVRAYDSKYYANLLKYFSGSSEITAKLYTAWHGNELLAANLMLYFRDTVIYLFGGSANIKRNLMAPYLLHFQAITDAQAQGFTKYDFWGIEQDPQHPWYGFSKFKLGFGGQIVKYPGTSDWVISPAWYNVYKFLRVINRVVKKIIK